MLFCWSEKKHAFLEVAAASNLPNLEELAKAMRAQSIDLAAVRSELRKTVQHQAVLQREVSSLVAAEATAEQVQAAVKRYFRNSTRGIHPNPEA